MMEAVDKADAAKFNESEILDPQGWILLSFLMDPRTGLGRFREFRISNYELMMQLIDLCLERSVDEILAHPDVAERVALYREHAEAATEQIRRCSTVHGRVVVLDLRDGGAHPSDQPLHGLRAASRSAPSPSTCSGACAGRTPCSRSAARSSTAHRPSTSAG